MKNIKINTGNLRGCVKQLTVSRWLSKWDASSGRIGVHTWFGRESSSMPRVKNKKIMIKPSELLLATVLAHFPLPLELPFKSTLDPPSVNQGQFHLKVPRPAAQSEIQNGGVAVSPRNRFYKQFPPHISLKKNRFSRSANVTHWHYLPVC